MKYGGKRCVWCRPAHLMDDEGHYKPGNAKQTGVIYSDGLCKLAAKSLNYELDLKEKKKAAVGKEKC